MVALANSAPIRCHNPNMSALAYRLSLILLDSSICYEHCRRLNHLGVCMSHPMVIYFQIKMNKTFDHTVMYWKREIEETKSNAMFLQEITEKQIPLRAENDMHMEIVLYLDQNTLKDYRYYSDHTYKGAIEAISKTQWKLGESQNESYANKDVITGALFTVNHTRIPLYKYV